MDREGPRHVVALLVLSGVVAGCIGVAASHMQVLRWAEQQSVDARFSLRASRPPSPHVTIVGLDADSLRSLPRPPLPRSLQAQLVNRLRLAGATVVAYDFSLERPSSSAQQDQELASALAKVPSVVSVTAVRPGGLVDLLAGRRAFRQGGVEPGLTLLPLDRDGVVRRFPDALGGVRSLALASAQRFATRQGGPTDPPSGALIDYPGPAGTVPSIPFADVLRGDVSPERLRGKVVVVGPTAPLLADVHRSSVDAAMSGAEIHAAAIATALDDFPLRVSPQRTTNLLLILLGLSVPLLLLTVGAMRLRIAGPQAASSALPGTAGTLLVGAGATVLWSIGCQAAFAHGRVLDYSAGALTIAAATAGAWLLASTLERRERQRLRTLFAAYKGGVVEQVLAGNTFGGLSASGIINGYSIESQIQRGGMGVVYRAVDTRHSRPVALKLISPELAADPILRARFKRECQLAASVSHPYIVPVFDFGEDDGLLYLAMQYVEGADLQRALHRAGALEPTYAARLVAKIAIALDAAHARGLIHRDVKPANVLIPSQDPEHPYLTDFGLARRDASGSLTIGSGLLGTPDYLAPEQINGESHDPRVDIYALTAMLYHLLTGQAPFPRETVAETLAAHSEASRPSAARLRPDLPPAVDHVIARGMAVTPTDRYETAGALSRDLHAALGMPSPSSGLAPAFPNERTPIGGIPLKPTAGGTG